MSISVDQNPRILVFDSGVGGLSITREIQAHLQGLSIIYASDNAAFPYGTKPEAELISRVNQVMEKLLARYPVDIVVIACNTASTLTLPYLRNHFSMQFVGVVPAIKPAAETSSSKVIGLLATPATVERAYTHDLIKTHAADFTVISLGSSELVYLAEQKLRGELISDKQITPITQALLDADGSRRMDRLVLACTHFPLLKEELSRNLPERISFVDSGEAIARRVSHLLEQKKRLPKTGSTSEHLAVFTEATTEAKLLQGALAGFGIYRQEYVQI
jgi:glutamate racemase